MTVDIVGESDFVSQLNPPAVNVLTIHTGPGGDHLSLLRLGNQSTNVYTEGGPDTVDLRSDKENAELWIYTGDGPDQIEVMQIGPSCMTNIHAGPAPDTIRVLGYRLNSDVSLYGDGPRSPSTPGDTLVFDAGDALCEGSCGVPNGDAGADGSSYRVTYQDIEHFEPLEGTVVVSVSPAEIAEGDLVTLHAATSPPVTDDNAFTWDLNGDGLFGDGIKSGRDVSFTWGELQWLGIDDDGVYDVAVRVTLPNTTTYANSTLTIEDTVPIFDLSDNAPIPAGDLYELSFRREDPGDDPIVQWTIHWGDATEQRPSAAMPYRRRTSTTSQGCMTFH